MVGDADSDLQAGRRAGCRTILARTGYGRETEAAIAAGIVRGKQGAGEMASAPWAVVDDLGRAVEAILGADLRTVQTASVSPVLTSSGFPGASTGSVEW